MELNVEFELLDQFAVAFDSPSEFTADFGVLHEISGSDINVYQGAYLVEPDFTEHVLATKNKMLTDDVTVNAIEVQRVSNTSGGRTVYIGGLING
ncbi:MAG: hypothetical protein ACI4TH_05270 [Candidatus Ornithomonoglobus sp.]